jgi:universal stress protein E
LIAPAHKAGIDVQTRVRTGRVSIEITRQVLEAGHDLVIKSAEAPRGIQQALFGSIDLQLLRQCPCPVWVNRSPKPHYQRILAAVDPGPPPLPEPAGESDGTLQSLNEKILQLAVGVADLEESEVHVVHAWDAPAEHLLRTSLDVEERQIQQLLQTVENEHRLRFERLLNSFPQAAQIADTHFARGSADVVIPQVAVQLGVDLIVMGTVCRTGISGFLIGNTAESILNQVETSVLAIKPDGFVSPVRVPS